MPAHTVDREFPPLYRVLAAVECVGGERGALFGGARSPAAGVLIGLDGTIRCEDRQRRLQVPRGTLRWFRADDLGTLRLRSGAGPGRMLMLVLGGEAAIAHAAFLERRFGAAVSLSVDDEPVLRARRIVRRRDAGLAGSERLAHDWLVSLHRHLEMHRLRLSTVFGCRADDARLRSLAGVTVKQLASSLGYSRAYLARLLEARWGSAPGLVLRRQRHELAAELLRTTNDSVTLIAERAGFSSVSAFCSSFRRFCAMPPGRFRRSDPPGPSAVQRRAADPASPPRVRRAPRANQRFSKFPDRVSAPNWDGPYFRLLNCGESDLPTARPFEIAFSSMERRHIINLTLEGQAVLELNGRALNIEAGTAVVYPAPLNARLRTEAGLERWRRIWLQFSGEWADRLIAGVIQRHGFVHRIPATSSLVRRARRLVGWVRRGRAEPPLFWSEHAFRWLCDWRDWVSRTTGPGATTALDLTRSQTRFLDRPASSLVEYARHVGYSPSHLSERLRLQWNMTPGAALRAARIDHAGRLLRTTSLPVSEVARRSGYAGSGPLIVAFRRSHGLTPLAYRHRHRQSG